MRRVLVIGSGGAGKSTFSAKLGLKLGLPVLHLDAYFWSTGWVESDKAEWRQTVARILTRLSALSDDKQIIVLKTQRQMDVFLMGLK